MIITVAFDVKNYVEVMEGWPIKSGETTFFLEREENVLKRVCLAFSKVGIEHAPKFTPSGDDRDHAHIQISSGGYADLARMKVMSWQAIVSGIQIVDIDYDNYELRFNAENIEEESRIGLTRFRSSPDRGLNRSCDFEQIGRAFCAGQISDDRIESTTHFREGRLAFEAGRYVDAYNNMFLFLETRYCDGKTKTAQQVDLLSKEKKFCDSLERTIRDFLKENVHPVEGRLDLLSSELSIRERIEILVKLRGKLRHHSLKSPHRWDPNRQAEHEPAARFLGAVVGDIVVKESLSDIYAPGPLKAFRDVSVRTGHETKVKLSTYRLERLPMLALDMSYPTTVISSHICLVIVRNAISECKKDGQLSDTVIFEATTGRDNLEMLSVFFDNWAYTNTRQIETKGQIVKVRCSFEHFRAPIIVKHEFSIPVTGQVLTILDVWSLLEKSFDHIEKKDPTTRIMSLKLFLGDRSRPIATYRVGPMVKN